MTDHSTAEAKALPATTTSPASVAPDRLLEPIEYQFGEEFSANPDAQPILSDWLRDPLLPDAAQTAQADPDWAPPSLSATALATTPCLPLQT